MALYRFEAKIISRSGGRSTIGAASYRTGKCATSAAAYRAGAQLTDERTGVTYDYGRKRGVLGAEIKLPEHAPVWMGDRQQLWNAVERIEKRKDAQLARDFIISLPHELDPTQRKALLDEYLDRNFVQQGYVCDVAYHAPHGKGDDRNHHAHVMVPMRKVTIEGFAAKKERPEGNPHAAWQTDLARLRKDWADTTNHHLEHAGRPERVSHLSLADQGAGREPEPKQGPIATQMEREGRESHAGNDRRAVHARNAELAALKAEHAAVSADIGNLVSLEVERTRRNPMREITPQEIELEHYKEQAQLRQMADMAERLRLDQERVQREAEQGKQLEEEQKRQEQEKRDQAARDAQAGEIADAQNRHRIALGHHYDIRDPYGSMARAGMEEYATFIKQQDELRRQISSEQDVERRDQLELRRKVEANEYTALLCDRNAGHSVVISGRTDDHQAELDRQRAQEHRNFAQEQRAQYEAIQKRQQEAERQNERGQADANAAALREAAKRETGEQEQRDREAASNAASKTHHQEASERSSGDASQGPRQASGQSSTAASAKQEKLDRLAETHRGYSDRERQGGQQRSSGGRGR